MRPRPCALTHGGAVKKSQPDLLVHKELVVVNSSVGLRACVVFMRQVPTNCSALTYGRTDVTFILTVHIRIRRHQSSLHRVWLCLHFSSSLLLNFLQLR